MKQSLNLLLVLLLFCGTTVQAQMINGFLRDSITHYPISGGTITNATSGRSIKTDNRGFFRLRVEPNDRLYAVANAYRFDTLTYTTLFSDTVIIYLAPTGAVLPTVTVTAEYNRYQLDSIARRKAFEAARGPVMPTVASTPSTGFGLSINMDKFWSKEAKRKRQLDRTYHQAEEEAYVYYRYSPEVVAYYTGLKGDELKAFMQRYTPSYEWLRQHPYNEDVMYYLNDKIKLYKARRR
ncbi:MAG TPA: hypothetical protein VGE66_13880 [Chitinophagaceae bacterium]